MNNDQMIKFFTILLMVMIFILVILTIIFIVLKFKSRKPKTKKQVISKKDSKDNNVVHSYNKQSIFKFMEFDKIEDNMIIQNNGKRFLMVVECQGINYDLMSGLEKNSVEQGFLQFLNTLRYPIQIYVQTRTVNLSNSIDTYKDRISDISKNLAYKQNEYNQKVRSGQYTEQELQKARYELIRQKNLYEYGIDIIGNTQRMSLNRNILSKHYYVIIPYYPDELGNNDFDKEEISNIAFSELYTKAQTIISALSVCNISSKILNSTEISELLYVAYNRDESEIFNLHKSLNSGYEDLYTTAPDVLDKRMRELDIKIKEDAIKEANSVIYDVLEDNEKQRRIKQKENELDMLIDQMAMAMIEENRKRLGEDVVEKAQSRINNKMQERKTKTKEEGGEDDGKKTKTTRRKSTKSV